MISCEYATRKVAGLTIYLVCSATNQFCKHQRYCATREDVVNTEGAENCEVKKRVYKKKKPEEVLVESAVEDIVSEIINVENSVEPELKPENEQPKIMQKATVTLVTKSYVVYDLNGNSCYKNGHFNVKIGDKIEV